ncbi:hypothetical protein GCM10009839_07080 [Catenulispora yoronensis]|uniref:Uncharacterized protein n=1 Tax=Catenulispora yoronensis TaxID=450799 RepID=A0ABN2TN50_9ACTN
MADRCRSAWIPGNATDSIVMARISATWTAAIRAKAARGRAAGVVVEVAVVIGAAVPGGPDKASEVAAAMIRHWPRRP